MSKKIVIVGPAFPYRGGIAAFNERLATELQDMGHQVHLITFTVQYPSFLFPGKTQYSTGEAPAHLKIERKVHSFNPINWIKTGSDIRKMKPDIVLLRYWLPFMAPSLGTIARQVKKNKHTEIVCIADNIVPHEKRPGDHWLTRYFIKPIDRFVVMSETVLNQLRRFDTHKIATLIPHPLYDHFGDIIDRNKARQQLGLSANTPILLFFGFIRHYKGLDLLIEAMALLRQQPEGCPCQLMVAGEFYEDEEKYRTLIKERKLQDWIVLKNDFIADDEVKYYFCAADGVVQPYRHATQSGVTPLAYHFEKPMIVTRVGGLPDLVPEGKIGLVCDPDPDSIAWAIRRFFEMGPSSFSPWFKDEKRKYSWKRMALAVLG